MRTNETQPELNLAPPPDNRPAAAIIGEHMPLCGGGRGLIHADTKQCKLRPKDKLNAAGCGLFIVSETAKYWTCARCSRHGTGADFLTILQAQKEAR